MGSKKILSAGCLNAFGLYCWIGVLVLAHSIFFSEKVYASSSDLMTITLFEEFATAENLSKLQHIDFPVSLFIAASSIQEFYDIEESLKSSLQVETIGYWPTLAQEEGYWLSPFSKRNGLQRIIEELRRVDRPLSVLWDAELPVMRKRLFLTGLPLFWVNRSLIKDFMDNPPSNVTLYVAEPPDRGFGYRSLLRFFALSFDSSSNYRRVEMLYGHSQSDSFRQSLRRGVQSENYSPAFGAIAEGVGGSAKTGSRLRLTPEELDEDLQIASEIGVQDVFIYRLGGIDERYAAVLKKYAKQ